MTEPQHFKDQDLLQRAARYHRLAEALETPADAQALHDLALRCEQQAAERARVLERMGGIGVEETAVIDA